MPPIVRTYVFTYPSGRVGEIASRNDHAFEVRILRPGPGALSEAFGGRVWRLPSFETAVMQANTVTGEASQPEHWAEANRD